MTNKTKRDLMISTWRRLGGIPVGMKELRKIQKVLRAEFGEGGLQSPASIARVLADAGAELKHPEIVEFDARWRESRIKRDEKKFRGLEQLIASEALDLKDAEPLIERLEHVRRRYEREGNRDDLAQLKELAVSARRAAQLIAKDRVSDHARKAEQVEVAEWLRVWIQTPTVFADWVELRKRSPEFKRMFAAEES